MQIFGHLFCCSFLDHLDPNWPCVFSGSLFRLRLKPCIPVEPNYLKLYFQSQLFERHILIWAHGSLTRNIGSDDIAELPLSLPPLGEQRRIVARVTQLMALIDQFQAAFSFSNLLAPKTPPKLPEQASEPNLQVKSADIASEPETQACSLKPEAAAPTPEAPTRKLAPEPALEPQSLSSDIASEPETPPAPLKPEADESTDVSPRKQTQPKSKPRHTKTRPATQLSLLDQIETLNDWS